MLGLDISSGYLPVWMFFISGVAVFNSIQNYVTTSLTQRVYSETNQGIHIPPINDSQWPQFTYLRSLDHDVRDDQDLRRL